MLKSLFTDTGKLCFQPSIPIALFSSKWKISHNQAEINGYRFGPRNVYPYESLFKLICLQLMAFLAYYSIGEVKIKLLFLSTFSATNPDPSFS